MFIPGKEYMYTNIFGMKQTAKFIQDSKEGGHNTHQFELKDGKKVWLLKKQISERFN